ncbi:MAG: zinc ribbon domain-containing protein [Candidatus Helarchaeota archaeon]|nr:zinc ribbon domain-containing protein [Candidatus Helarchaeota archaeon]
MTDKFKVIKVSILKRSLNVQEKKGPNETTTFAWHEGKTVVKNLAFWKIAERGLITADDVRTVIYQLEKANLVEIIDRNKLRLTPRGSQIAREIRTMKPKEVPDHLLEGQMSAPSEQERENICPKCGKEIEPHSIYCEYCGTRTQKFEEFCTYCGAIMKTDSKFCVRCGKKL